MNNRKVIRTSMIVSLLISSLLFSGSNVISISQHEVADGTVIGYIENSTIYEGESCVLYPVNDSYVSLEYPDTNYGTNNYLRFANASTPPFVGHENSMIHFNLSSIPSNANITSAILSIYYYAMGTGAYVNLYRNTQIWNESTVTWNTRPTFTSGISGTINIDSENQWEHVTLTDNVSDFCNGVYTNYGWTLNASNPTGFTSAFRSSDYPTSSYYPYLSVEYAFHFNVSRNVSTNTESNSLNFTCTGNHSSNINLKVPVSSDVRGIVDVTNNTVGILAIEVNSTEELINNTYWYDSANQYVYIRTINLSYGKVVNWTVNCSYGMDFNIPIPTYKTVGDDIEMNGRIVNSTDVGMNVSARTHIYNSTGADVVTPVHEWYCHWGNYECTIPTSGLIPGIYSISIEVVDPDSGITFKYGDTLYLSFETPDGVYSDALVYFNFYNTNIGLGLIPETFKVYIDDVRIYENRYYGYTGQTINITIRDYYDFVMTTTEYTIIETYTGLNFGLTFHEYDFTNENSEYFYASFLKSGATRWYERVVSSSGGQKSFMLPSGNYSVRVYNADNSSYVSWTETINRSKAYLIGTDGVTLIIQGQSVIIGDLLEFSQDLNNALLPSVVDVCYNTPQVWTKFRYEGLPIGWDLVCPAQVMTATTLNSSTGGNFTSYPLIPTTGTTENGTITVNKDKIFIGSGITWLNVSFGGTYTNYTDIPPFISPFGANVTLNASGNFTSIRETEFQQLKTFYWSHSAELDFYKATVPFENTLGAVIREVYCYIEFPNEDMEEDDTEPKYSTVKVYDVTNGIYIVTGEDFDAGATGIKFQLPSINTSETRSFECEFYVKESVEQSNYAVTTVNSYRMKELDGKNSYYADAQYVNRGSNAFIGSLIISLNFSTYPYVIGSNSFRVYDEDNNHFLSRETGDFSFGGQEVTIVQDTLGTVQPNSARTFTLYWNYANEDEEHPLGVLDTSGWLRTQISPDFPIFGSFQIFHLLGIISIALIIMAERAHKDKEKKIYRPISMASLLFLIIMIFVYL